MSQEKLAILGGKPVRNKKNHPFPNVDVDDIVSIIRCFKNKKFSGFRAGFYDGGEEVQNFEKTVAQMFEISHSVAFDTWSNGIIACLMAIDIQAGDEVLITPYTMTSCATSVLTAGGVPVFVDVSLETGNIDPDDIERKITNKTKAIFVVHLFGIPADMDRIMEIASRHNLYVFEDCAQSPLSTYKGKLTGTIGDVGGFSLTESKHVMSGEGGIAITDNNKINNGLRVIRNHGEVMNTVNTDSKNYSHEVFSTTGLTGFNFRMTEITAALANSQWKKLKNVVETKRKLVNYLHRELEDLNFITIMKPQYESEISWYQIPLRFNEDIAGISRERFVEALNAEGMNFASGYVDPLYNQSIYRDNKHWVVKEFGDHIDYSNPKCPNVEILRNKELITTLDVRPPYTIEDMKDIVKAFKKISKNIKDLK